MNNSYSTAKTNQGAFECANVPYTGTLFHLAILPGPYLSWIWVRPNLTQSVIDRFWCPKLFVPEQFKVQILSFKLFVFLSLSVIWLPAPLFINLLYRHCMVFMIKYLSRTRNVDLKKLTTLWGNNYSYQQILEIVATLKRMEIKTSILNPNLWFWRLSFPHYLKSLATAVLKVVFSWNAAVVCKSWLFRCAQLFLAFRFSNYSSMLIEASHICLTLVALCMVYFCLFFFFIMKSMWPKFKKTWPVNYGSSLYVVAYS